MRPFDLLDSSIGKQVLVTLKGGVVVSGILRAFDVHLNLVLDNATKLENGEVKERYGSLFVRGDTVLLISPAK